LHKATHTESGGGGGAGAVDGATSSVCRGMGNLDAVLLPF